MFLKARKFIWYLALGLGIIFIAPIILSTFFDIYVLSGVVNFFKKIEVTISNIFIYIIIGIFSIVLLGLFFQFFGKQQPEQVLKGNLLYEVKKGKAGYIIMALVSAGLFCLFAWVVFKDSFSSNDDLFSKQSSGDELGNELNVIFGFFLVVGIFIFIVSLKNLFKDGTEFRATSQGFMFNPGGIPTTLLWTDVLRLEEQIIDSTNGRFGSNEAVVAIILKDPGKAYKPALHPVFAKILAPIIKLREAQSGTILFISPRLLGKHFEPVYTLMKEQVAKHQSVT